MHRKIRIIFLILIILMVSVDPTAYTYRSNAATKVKSTSSTSSTKVYKAKDKLIAAIRAGLLERKAQIKLKIPNTNEFDNVEGFIDEALVYDDKTTAKDGDYLAYSLSGWKYKTNWIVGGSTKELTILPKYMTTLKEEQAIDKKITGVLKALKLTGASDYAKVKAIHDYIIKRVNYDTNYTNESAYQALINRSSVCSGYALSAYRMFTEAGLQCKIISGYGNGGSHAWNIVQVDGNWYNIDLTWDDPITSDGSQIITYDYFLKNEEAFDDHSRDEKYETEAFLQQYPIAETSYEMKK